MIADGLNGGEEVVTDGQLRLTPGRAVVDAGADAEGADAGSRSDRHEHSPNRSSSDRSRRRCSSLTILIFGIAGYRRCRSATCRPWTFPRSR